MNHGTLSKIPSARDIVERLQNTGKALINLAADYVAGLDARPELAEEILALGVSRETLTRLERLGRGEIDHRLALSFSMGASKLARFPLSIQQRVLNDGVEVWDPSAKEPRSLPLDALTPLQVSQVFDRSGVRPVATQRSWLSEREQLKTEKAPKMQNAVVVRRDVVKIMSAPVTLSRADILDILRRMEG